MAKTRDNEESRERVDDVMVGISRYGLMMATLYHASDRNPIVPIMGADWMAQLIMKLVEWGVLSEQEHSQLMFRMAAESAERRAEAARRQNEDGTSPDPDQPHDLIAQLGI